MSDNGNVGATLLLKARIVLGSAGQIVLWSKEAERLFGYGYNQVVNLDIKNLLPNVSGEKFGVAVQQVLSEQIESWQQIMPICCADGKGLLASVAISPLRNRWGQVTGAYLSFSTRKGYAKAKEQGKRGLDRDLEKVLSCLFIDCDREDALRRCLQAAMKVTGSLLAYVCVCRESNHSLTPELMVRWDGQEDTVTTEFGFEVGGFWPLALLQKQVVVYDHIDWDAQRELLPVAHPRYTNLLQIPLIKPGVVEAVMTLAGNGAGYGLHNTQLYDVIAYQAVLVLEHLALQTSIDKSQLTLRHLSRAVEQAGEAIMITDTKGVIGYANHAFEEISGYKVADVIGKKPSILASGKHPADFYRHLWAQINSGQVWRGQFTNKKLDGSLYIEDATISSIRDPKTNEITHFVAVKRDITELKALENQLRHAQKMEAVGTLAGGIAHDYNNMLGAILGSANLIKMYSEPGSDVFKSADVIESVAAQAAEITQQLLRFSRRGRPHTVAIGFHQLITKTIDMLRSTLHSNIDVVADLKAEDDVIMGDYNQIVQVLLNLALNAQDAMPEGGVLSISTQKVYLDAEYCLRNPGASVGCYLKVGVADNGFGIDPKHQNRVYEPFFTTKGEGKGTGMGLAVAYSIMKDHHGMIMLYSEQGVGTVFSLYFQLKLFNAAAGRQQGGAVAADKVQASGAIKRRIMVVDDDSEVLSLSAEIIKGMSYYPVLFNDAADAVGYYRDNWAQIDAVIIDMIMPYAWGQDVFMEMKQVNPNIKTLLTSGYAVNMVLEELVYLGIKGFIEKPFLAKRVEAEILKLFSEDDD